LRSALERITIPLAHAAAAFVREEAWVPFGFARLGDHARERFDRSGRWVRDLATLGKSLSSLPALAPALTGEDGGPPIGRGAALLIGRVANPASLPAWLLVARAASVRDLRDTVKKAIAEGSSWPAGAESSESSMAVAADGVVCNVTDESLSPIEAEDRSLVRMAVPAPLLAAFDEAVDLYRAIEGVEASVTSFTEALVGESSAGGNPPGVGRPPGEPGPTRTDEADRVLLNRGTGAVVVEAALARSTGGWSHLSPSSPASWALHLAGSSLARLDRLSRAAGTGGPVDLDGQIRALVALENEFESRLGRLLSEMAERGAWSRLRFAGVGHYAERRLGLSRTSAEDRLRAARALRRFPLLRTAYEEGDIGLEATLVVLRILGPGPVGRDTEAAWLARAPEATVKRLREEARALGRRPFDGLGGRVTADQPVGVDRPVGEAADPAPLDDAEWHASLRREPGTARGRILHFGFMAAAWAERAGALASPDVFLRLRLPHDLAEDFLVCVESARRARGAEVDRVPWNEPWPEANALPSTLAARTFSTRSRRVPAWVGFLALLEDFALTWDGERRVGDRNRQASPRRHGDAVYERDGWRCSAPACTSRRNLEDHHLVYRSRQGSDDLTNRLCLCRFHHQRGQHGGLASCGGEAPLDVTWRLGRARSASWFRNERRLQDDRRHDRPPLPGGASTEPEPGAGRSSSGWP
jgi:hypothetical protein